VTSTRSLSDRLRAVADLALEGLPAADIGCDHGQLAAWWVASGRIPSAIASDLRPGPLAQARRVLRAAGLERQVDVRQGSGLSTLVPGEVATIAIAGMGGHLMLELLDAHPDVLAQTRRVVLQPNTAWVDVRRDLAKRGVSLEAEQLTESGGHVYLTLAFDPRTRGTVWNDADILLGPRLRTERGPAFLRWLAARREHLTTLRARLAQDLGETHPRLDTLEAELATLAQASSDSMKRPT